MSSYSPSCLHRLQYGGTGGGFLAGLLVGLLAALAVALYVTNAPLPFASPNGRSDKLVDKSSALLSDPNKSLYTKDAKDGRLVVEPLPSSRMGTESPDIAPSAPDPATNAVFFLQAGSFKSLEDAEQLRARLALAGVEANLSSAQVDGADVNRVRVGPFTTAEEAYRTRAKLTENGFEARLVKPAVAKP
jgi:cell division protein FtsN